MGYINGAVLTAKSVRRRQGGTEAAKGPVLHADHVSGMNEGAAKKSGTNSLQLEVAIWRPTEGRAPDERRFMITAGAEYSEPHCLEIEQAIWLPVKVLRRQPLPVYDAGQWRAYGCELESCTREYPTRTPYFYKREAIKWFNDRRICLPENRRTALRLAVYYIDRYRELSHAWAAITAGIGRSDGLLDFISLRRGRL